MKEMINTNRKSAGSDAAFDGLTGRVLPLACWPVALVSHEQDDKKSSVASQPQRRYITNISR